MSSPVIGDHLPRSGPRALLPNRSRQRQHSWRFRCSLLLSLCLILGMELFSNGVVMAASVPPPRPPTLPVAHASFTLQQFLQQRPSATNAPLLPGMVQASSALARSTSKPTVTSTPPLPSAEPATMKSVSQTLSAAFLHAAVTPSGSAQSPSSPNSVPPLHLIGSDAHGVRMEVEIPAGALDLSAATTTNGTAPVGTLTVALIQLHGHFFSATTDLGQFQLQFTDGQGQPVQGVRLRAPITLRFRYQPDELTKLGIDPRRLTIFWPGAGASASSSSASSIRATPSPNVTLSMQHDAANRTLSVQTSAFAVTPFTVTAGPDPIQTPPKPNVASVQGNSGQLTYSYPLVVAPGPKNTVPSLALSYSSGNTNARHSPVSPADSPGEGWSLTMGAITAEKYPDGTTWYSISGVDNISDRLVPDNNGDDWVPEHLAYLKVQKVGTDPTTCFHVWDTAGTEFDFGCTTDSLQYSNNGSRFNYRWDLDKVIPASEGPGTNNRVMNLSYVQDFEGTTVRDAALKQISYGTTTPSGFVPAGTVDFFYNGPSTQAPWVTQYSSAYESACKLPAQGGQPERCDDPIDRNGNSNPDPDVMSTFSLQTVKTYVGDDSSQSHLDHSYALSYQDTAFGPCPSADTTLSNFWCAGDHLLTSITPTVYQNGTGHTLPGVTFGYSGRSGRINRYDDSSQHFHMETGLNYLTSYHDHQTGTGISSVTYHTAYNNSHGTPNIAGDNRYDALFCINNASACQNNAPFTPMDDKMWTEQVVTQIVSVGTDSSSGQLAPATTKYDYWLTQTQGSCPADSTGLTDCVGDGWIPNSGDTQSFQDYYHGELKGFGTVLITSPAGDLTVQKYASTWGWDSPQSDARNYLAGDLLEEDIYRGATINGANLLTQTVNTYAGQNGTPTSCSSNYTSTKYDVCEVILLRTKTIQFEQTGTGNSNAPWVQHDYTYDDYRSSGSPSGLGDYHNASPGQNSPQPGTATGSFHNLQQEVISSANAPTLTKQMSYYTTDTTTSNPTFVYHNVNVLAHSNLLDSAGHVWQCQDITYDEGVASGVPQPAAGLPTTVTTNSTCGNSATAIKTYTGYDQNGNVVATVDGVGAATPSLYSSTGCTLATAPAFITSAWSVGHYTGCTQYDSTSNLPTSMTNALGQQTQTAYDTTQGLLPVRVTDANNQTTTTGYSYDSAGNPLVQVLIPPDTTGYTKQSVMKSSCTDSSTLPCLEIDANTSQYSSAIDQTFYDSQGRAVETLTPGPDSSHTIVSFTVYNDQAHSVFKSVPFVVASRTSWLDPNTATDSTGHAPTGSASYLDALGRTIASDDPLFQSGTNPGIACPSLTQVTQNWQTPLTHATSCVVYGLSTSGVSGDSHTYETVTSIDANNHVSANFSDALGRVIYAIAQSGTNSGTLTPNMRKTFQYNALDKPISVTVTDLAPQSGQTTTAITTTTQYDDLGRMTTLVDPDRGTHTYSYDADGRESSDVTGTRTLGYSYDLLGRLGCLQNAVVNTLDVHGACSSGATPFVQNTYDTSPNGVTWTTFPVGRMTQSIATTANLSSDGTQGTVTENVQYDQRGRSIGATMQIAFSGGSLAFPTLPLYQQTLAYNDADQLTTTQTTVGGQPGYTFSQAYDSTTGVQVGLSNTSAAAPTLAALSYNTPSGLPSDLTFKDSVGANLANSHFSYDGDLRPAGTSTTWTATSGLIFSDGVSYDPMGNVISRATTQAALGSGGATTSEVQNFCYDEQNRMVWASNSVAATPASGQTCGTTAISGTLGAAYTSAYVYTHLGQIWRGPLNGTGSQEQYLYCNSGQPHQVTALSPAGGNPSCAAPGMPDYRASYDAFGNVTSRTYPITTTGAPVYNGLDQMISWAGTTPSSNQQEWYLYDAAGDRVLRRSASVPTGGNPATAAATITVYAFGLEEHVYQYSGSGSNATNTNNTFYYSLGGHLIGMLSGATPSTSFLLTDTLGSVVTTISNTAGNAQVQGTQVYGPYGNKRASAGAIGTSKGFTGQYADDLTGLDYYVARYYDPVIGRFLSADAAQGNLQGMDPYDYVGANPETDTDPSGHRMVGVADDSSANIEPISTSGNTTTWGLFVFTPPTTSSHGGVTLTRQWNGPTPKTTGGSTHTGGGSRPTQSHSSAPSVAQVTHALAQVAGVAGKVLWMAIDLVFNFSGMWHDIQVITDANASWWAKAGAVADLGFTIFTDINMLDGEGEAARAAEIGAEIAEKGVADVADKGISDAAGDIADCALSFSPRTPVATDHGKQAIVSLHPGDKVWAYNPQTGKMELQPILHVWINHDNDLVDLTITWQTHPPLKASQQSEVVHTTQKHPFLTIEKGFLPVSQLKPGMHVLQADGSAGVITGWKIVPGSATMYNLEVAQDHTYTVGDGSWVVHNCAQSTFKGWIQHDTYNQVRNQFGKKGVQRYVNAMQKGFVAAKGENGVKNLGEKFFKKWGYQYEIKVMGGPEGDYRIYGNFDPDTGFHIFDYFSRHLE